MALETRPISEPGSSQDKVDPQLAETIKRVKQSLEDMVDQLNTRAQVFSFTDDRVPTGLNRGDILIGSHRGTISIQIKAKDSYVRLNAEMLGGLSANGTNFKGIVSTTAAPVLADFPNAGDWGFHFKTTVTTAWKICMNFNGLLKTAIMS